ncbi:MAG: protein kinase, partial [Acidobacteriota bacterium]
MPYSRRNPIETQIEGATICRIVHLCGENLAMTTEDLETPPPESQPESWYGMQAGTVLADRYRVERLLSKGGMGAVFEATQLGLDRLVAVKMLLPTLSRDEKIQERFRREARSVAALRHPNIIQIYDYGIS